jgi:hypothetical protein
VSNVFRLVGGRRTKKIIPKLLAPDPLLHWAPKFLIIPSTYPGLAENSFPTACSP